MIILPHRCNTMNLHYGLFTAMICLLLANGCASTQPVASFTEDISPERKQRETQIADELKQRRNDAQIEAALSQWRQGNSTKCEKMLLALLQRAPGHTRARRTLADLYVATERPQQAVSHYRQLLAQDPEDAMAHHSLALLLDTLGNKSDSEQHLTRAMQLDPNNEIYALCKQTCTANPADQTVEAAGGLKPSTGGSTVLHLSD